MAGKGSGEARYGIKFDSNAAQVGAEGASALEQLRAKVASTKEAIKSYGDSLRNLKGSSDAVKSARAELKNKIDAERTALTQNTLAIVRAGTSYEKLTEAQKKMAKASEASKSALTKSLSSAGGPVASLRAKVAELREAFSTSEGRAAFFAKALVGIGVAAAVAAVAGVAALGALTVKFASWLLTSGNALRTQKLTREAFVGSEDDARRLGNQIEALGRKVPTTRAELNDLGNDLVKAGIRGQTLVDTLNATGQTAAALGGDAANKVRSFVERGRLSGRFSLGQLETQGTGLAFADVAAALAKNTHTSIQEAGTALIQGQVTLGDGAKALRDAVEKRFAGVNLAKMLDLDVMKSKLADAFEVLTADVDLTPVLNDLRDLFSLADTSTQAGSGLKELVTWIGSGLVDAIHVAAPVAKGFLENLILQGLKIELSWLKLKIQFRDTFGDDALDALDDLKVDFSMLSPAIDSVSGSLDALRANLAFIATVRAEIQGASAEVRGFEATWRSINWAGIGESIVEGILGPLKSVPASFGENAKSAIAAVKAAWGIASPSKVAEGISTEIDRGGIRGHAKMRSDVVDAAVAAYSPASVAAAGGASSSAGDGAAAAGGLPPIRIEFNYQGGATRQEAEQFADYTIGKFTAALEVLLRQRGFRAATP